MHVTDDAGTRTVTFDRPEVKNAMGIDTATDLATAIAETDPETHDAVVITGDGDAFSAGGDIQAMLERQESAHEAYTRIDESFTELARTMLTAPVPLVANVNGDAVGAGLAVVTGADFAIASTDASFSAGFIKVGLAPDTGATLMLPRLIGLRTAKELIFTGDRYSATDAAEMGLINRAVPADELDDAVDDLVAKLSRRPTRTLGLTKRAIHETMAEHWRDALEYETMIQTQARSMPEHEEGVSAFLERRRPDFD